MSKLALIASCVLCLLAVGRSAEAADDTRGAAEMGALASQSYVWIEGEAPAEVNVTPTVAGWGHPEFLSGGKWLQVSIPAGAAEQPRSRDAEKVEKEVPAEGVLIRYRFRIEQPGDYQVWNRIGYEFARSPFNWRVDDGEWQAVGPEQLTTDLMELSEWCEVAWLELGERSLTAGEHALEVQVPRTKDDKGAPARLLYASDALCLSLGPFHPHSRYQPDEDWRTPEDRAAAGNVFHLPAPTEAGARTSVALKGAWEVCRDDEQLPGEVAAPISALPKEPRWSAIQVPGDKNTQRPDLLLAHRLWYRTRVEVSASPVGRAFFLTFPQNNLNTTVYVNGVYCGFNKNPFARFSIDVTKGIQAGVNEIWVGIRDAYYGYSANPKDPMKLRRRFNLPVSFEGKGFQELAYPIWGHLESGLLQTPVLTAAGAVYVQDVFCQPSVAKKELAAEVLLSNRSPDRATGELLWEAVNDRTGEVEKRFPAVAFTLDPGADQTLRLDGKWESPRLWWPDDPNLYRLRTTVRAAGHVVDITETSFGFREWTSEGKDFKLNGIPWHGWADCHTAKTKEEWLAFYRKTNQRTTRFWGTTWQGMAPEEALDFLDGSGVVVRRSGMLDGEAIGYMAIEQDPDLKKESPIKMDLMRNWRDQMVAEVMGERNHPSIMIWSIENEWLYINCINLYSDLMDQFEAETQRTADAVHAVDPTRFTMTDGGGATKANTMPVHGDHYPFADYPRYPALAYEANPTGGGRGRWAWDQQRPRFIGEDFYANGINPADYSYFGGEETFLGKAQARPAAGLIYRMLTEGYRWAGYDAWQFWLGQDEARDQYLSNAPRAVFCREWDWTFGSGQVVKRTLAIFNDTRFGDPITFTWRLSFAGKTVASSTTTHHVAPGTHEEFGVPITMPKVNGRQEGELTLILTVSGQEVFRDTKAVSVLNTAGRPAGLRKLVKGEVLVYDPKGGIASFLKARGIPFRTVTDLAALPTSGKVLVVGKDAVAAEESTSGRLAAYARGGRTVIVLEQQHPLNGEALAPAEIEAGSNEGRTAFGEDLDHPALRGLKQKDFFTWGPDEVVYRNAYVKPKRGAKSLVQCDERLGDSALVEVSAGKGLMLLSQLTIGEKLTESAVAQQLLLNLITYGSEYRLEYRQVAACTSDDPQLGKALDAVGVRYARTAGPLDAISSLGPRIAIVSATPANLKTLAAHAAAVERFTQGGGWIVFHGLTPDGLADYNRIVGWDHMIRPFRRERVTFPAKKSPLTSGLTSGDIVMYSSERLFDWTSDMFVASDVFSYVVDYDEVAPFAQLPSEYHYNIVNGFVSADGWKYIFSFDLNAERPEFTMKFPIPQEITEFTWIGNAFYHLVTRVELTFDGKETLSFATEPNNELQTFAITPPRKVSDLRLRVASWERASKTANVVGIDNIYLKAKRPAEFYRTVRPMLNVGGLMEYRKGKGGIVLCNLLFKDQEQVPENAGKKLSILATILRNLKAPLAGQQQ